MSSPPEEGISAVFAYDRPVAERYPTIRAGLLRATGLVNGPSPPQLLDDYRAEQRAAAERLATTLLPGPHVGDRAVAVGQV